MAFSSTLFLCMFLPVSLLGYYLIRDDYKNNWLLFVSLLFFAWPRPAYLWILLLNIVINYSSAMLISRISRLRRLVLFAAVTVNLLILFYFKYFSFAAEAVNRIFGCSFTLPQIVLPVGISFFTFQGMSYVIDVYRQVIPVRKNLPDVALYTALFPQLTAGPIVRFKDIADDLGARVITRDDFSAGIERFIIGLGKKVIIADTMAAVADAIWKNGAGGNTRVIAWAGSIAYTLQIYYDFSGYSDMAIGLGRMFGFHIKENFNLPYVSKCMAEFWRRWHISLSSWFRDYVYIPLGGNKKHVYLNLAVVFLLTGLWHGAAWHFILWGIWHGIFILMERFFQSRNTLSSSASVENGQKDSVLHDRKWALKTALSKIYTLAVIHFGWIFFRAPTVKEAATYIAVMFGLIIPEKPGFTLFWYLDRWTITIALFGILFASSLPAKAAAVIKTHVPENTVVICKYAALLLLLYLSMLEIVSGTYQTFIYFRF